MLIPDPSILAASSVNSTIITVELLWASQSCQPWRVACARSPITSVITSGAATPIIVISRNTTATTAVSPPLRPSSPSWAPALMSRATFLGLGTVNSRPRASARPGPMSATLDRIAGGSGVVPGGGHQHPATPPPPPPHENPRGVGGGPPAEHDHDRDDDGQGADGDPDGL